MMKKIEELEFKRDFADAQARWRAFWQGRNRRPLVSIVLPKDNAEPVSLPAYMSGADGNFQPVIDRILAWAASHEFLGDAIPFYHLEFGPNHFSALLGADLKFDPASSNTSWCQPFVRDWDEIEIKLRRDGFWWQRTIEFVRALKKRCEGKLLIAAPTLSGNLDALAAIRGTTKLMMDLAVCPDNIRRALNQVDQAYGEILEAFSIELDFARFGSINRHGMYCEGKIDVLQCDASAMISPEMFLEFAVPSLRRECKFLDAAEYHLDGPDAIKHLEAICRIENIGVIQWVPGDEGPASTKDWTDLYKKIDGLGKGQILGENPSKIKQLWREYGSNRLFFHSTAVTSRKEAEDFLKELEDNL